ncbi:MAG: dipeptidase [Saprospiraceae bacterium]|nr:dipeptidase [Saprospiraceae bacterium]MCB0591329.1 dipeptidase [Saprospiraceae bacterium]MCO5283498.1 dipeptidase [Saprospiraceae bacterium]MCO6470315.1 dipeptidase [Saprospiraceae bacterium]HMY83233.1 dipeptidase [Saprospiraceae bacterium]
MSNNEYIAANRDRFLNELVEWLKIPSISSDSRAKEDMGRAAEYLKARLVEQGVDRAEIYPTAGHPIVYAEKITDPAKPTVLVYGHYDVQPPDPLDLWDSPPFEPVIKITDEHPEGAIFARGSCDDKGQVYMHVKAFEVMAKNNDFPCNIKFMIEGEEEIGSVHLGKFCEDHKDMLKSDVILISDTSIIDNQTPSITTGLRGLAYMEVEVTGANRDLHSGVYGGAVANPINVLAKMIAGMHDENNHITIPGFYDAVENLSREERDAMAEAPFSLEGYQRDLGIDSIYGENGYTTLERASIRPTLDVNGIWGGYIGEGAKTVLPSKAFAKISMRLVPHQNSTVISKLFSDYFTSIAPKGVKVKVTPHHGGEPVVTPVDSLEYKAAAMAMKDTFGTEPIPQRSGGSIPIVALFESVLGTKSVLMGFGLDSDDIHSPNEHYGVFNFFKGIETILRFYPNYAALKQ